MKPSPSLHSLVALLIAAGAVVAVERSTHARGTAALTPGSAITGDRILQHIRALSDDTFEGRAPGSRGEDLTIEYLTREARRIGLEPGNPDGSYTQEVPLVGITSTWTATVDVKGTTIPLRFGDDYAPASLRVEPETRVDASPIVFVGYGVRAPDTGGTITRDSTSTAKRC